MTNTHITVGGHKVTTNKVGQVHNATLETGFSGTVKWAVTNGVCTVSFWLISASATGITQTIANNLPKAKLSVGSPVLLGGVTTPGMFAYIDASSTTLKCNVYVSGGGYGGLIYPVADDWVES